MRYNPRAPRRFFGKDAEQYLEFVQQKVGILPALDLGYKLDEYFLHLKLLTGETMAEWSIRSDGSRLERATGRKTKVSVCDSSAQTKPYEEVEELETVADFDGAPSVGTARSRPWSTQGRSLQSARTSTSRRIVHEFGMIDIPRSHLARPS